MICTCPKCDGKLVLEDAVLFCTECLYVVNRYLRRDSLDDEIRKLRQQGLSWREVGRALDLTARSVLRRFRIAFGEDHELLRDTPSMRKKKETTILAYHLHVDNGFSYTRIAKILDIPVTTCKQKIYRERRRIR